jgi:hypothetical protein
VVDNDGGLVFAKFPKLDDDRSITHGEVLAMTLAADAGLNVSRAAHTCKTSVFQISNSLARYLLSGCTAF